MNKIYKTYCDAVADIHDGALVLLGGFGECGQPQKLINALAERGAKNLTCVSNNCGNWELGPATLIKKGLVKKMIASFPMTQHSHIFRDAYLAGQVELELVPQGTLAERIRAGGAGIGGFYTRTGVGTVVEKGKEKKVINGDEYLLEMPIKADFALIKARKGDRHGNLVYRKTARTFNPVMATAAKVTIVEVDEIVELGELGPEEIVTPGIFVDRVVKEG